MKKILVPTDFSAVADTAVNYAGELANLSNAEIILFHVYPIPVVPTETMVILPTKELEEGCMAALHKTEKELQNKFSNKLRIKCSCMGGFVTNEINAWAEANSVDLIVMGMEGAGYLTEKLLGTNTSILLRKAKCPVLTVHKNTKFKKIERILLASDYSSTKSNKVLGPLKELAALFKSHIYVLNVTPEPDLVPTTEQAVAGIHLDHTIEALNHTFHTIVDDDVVEGINQFALEKKIDLIVMIPHAHNIFERLIHEPNTKRLAFHTNTPLFVLH